MSNHRKKVSSNYRVQKNTTAIISFIGLSFIFIAVLNFFIDIPVEFVTGVSFAGFFFVWADFLIINSSEEKPYNERRYFSLLFLAVMSFILLPLVLPLFPNLLNGLADSSESVSIASLGLVLIIIHFKMWDAEDEFFNELFNLITDSENKIEELNQMTIDSTKKENETKELINNKLEKVEESLLMSQIILEQNNTLIKMIEEEKDLNELKEKIKKFK